MSFIINPYRYAVGGGSNIASGSEIAYSLRYISTSYSGDVILARRGGDNVEEGFTPTEISDGTLTSWTSEGSGDGNGFVKTWYDQSGNGNNATGSNQPRIVSGGVLETTNSLPSMDVSGSSEFLILDTTLDHTSGYTSFHVEDYGGTGYGVTLATGSSIPYTPLFISADIYIANGDYYFQDLTPSTTSGQMVISGFCPADGVTTGQDVRINGTAQTMSANNFTNSTSQFQYLFRRGSNYTDSPGVQEFIFFNGDQTSKFSDIETDINDYYSIY